MLKSNLAFLVSFNEECEVSFLFLVSDFAEAVFLVEDFALFLTAAFLVLAICFFGLAFFEVFTFFAGADFFADFFIFFLVIILAWDFLEEAFFVATTNPFLQTTFYSVVELLQRVFRTTLQLCLLDPD